MRMSDCSSDVCSSALFCFIHARRKIDARRFSKPEQCANLDRVVVVVDAPSASPVLNAGFLGEQAGHVGTGKTTSRCEKLGDPGADSVGQRRRRNLLAGGKQV